MTRTPEQAIEWGTARIGDFGWDNLCLSFVRQSFGIDYVGDWPTSERQAGRAWDRAKHKHPTSDAGAIPRGVPVFWELATEADHVALSLGNGWCLSNDFVVDGRIDKVRIADISNRWGRLLGWTEDLVGNRVIPEKEPVKPMRVDGVDISHHQDGTINYAAAKTAGVKWMYHKATEGASYVDPNYTRRREEARKAGIPFGAYHFARAAVGDAESEARAFLAYATPKPGDLRPALDLETTEGLSLAQLRTWAGTWVRVVEKATGAKPIVYTPYDLGDAVKGCLIWRPRYNDDNRPPDLRWDIWQFSNGVLGKPDLVAGFGHVDLNTMRGGLTLADLRIPKREPKPARPQVATWNVGDGPDRDKARGLDRLVAAGADVICLQEAGDRQAMLGIWCALTNWQMWPGDGSPGSASVPILWNPKAVRALHTDTRPATPETDAGPLGAGPDVVKAKVWNKVRFETDDDADLLVINGHGPASVWARRRRALAREMIAVGADIVERREVPVEKDRVDVVLVGDLNMRPRHSLTKPLRDLGMKQRTKDPTHGRRCIDHVWTLGCEGRTEVLPMPSDHRAVVLTVA